MVGAVGLGHFHLLQRRRIAGGRTDLQVEELHLARIGEVEDETVAVAAVGYRKLHLVAAHIDVLEGGQ